MILEKIKRSIVQSAILWEVMKSYKILENVVISTQRDRNFQKRLCDFSQVSFLYELRNPPRVTLGVFLLVN